jgi:radical SAM protein with 4Fe4S-binding SPASM domain
MEFPLEVSQGVNTPGTKTVLFHYAGRPDLPIEMGGQVYVLDHKTTSSYLSDWYFSQYKLSNQLRGYCAMLESLTGLRLGGALVNGVYVGEKATASGFTGAKFARYGPLMFQPGHLYEALLNQYYWKQQLYRFHEMEYFPQNAGKACQSCDYLPLCTTSPASREVTMRTDYRRTEMNVMETFLSL